MVFAYMGPPEQRPPFPRYDSFSRPGYRLVAGPKYYYPCNWLQILENAMDPVHTAFLHTIVSGSQFTDDVSTTKTSALPSLSRRPQLTGFTSARLEITPAWVSSTEGE
jgi:phenylpropionate dioxygenase-like ring-hydroxylating dioxygenase large terminal subunit